MGIPLRARIRRLFKRPVGDHPGGDVDQNISSLAQEPVAQDPTMMKFQFLARFRPAELRGLLKLLLDRPCTVQLVEKGHSAGAFVRRSHRLVNEAKLACRAYLSELRALTRPCHAERRLSSLEAAFQKPLYKSRVVRFSAANAFLQVVLARGRELRERDATIDGKAMVQACVGSHNEKFMEMTLEDERAYAVLAGTIRQCRKAQHMDDARNAYAALLLQQERERERQRAGWRVAGL